LPSTVEQVMREFRGQRLAVVIVNIQEAPDKVAAWVKAKQLTSLVLLDADADVARDYRVSATPTVFLIDREGRLVARAAGTRDWAGEKGRALLRLLAGPPVR
jgi:peroxiredoxin